MTSFQNKVTLYVGANNTTGKVDKTTLELILNDTFDGYTVVDSVGYWQGTKEESVVVTIFTDEGREFVDLVVMTLRTALNQYSILVECSGERYLIDGSN